MKTIFFNSLFFVVILCSVFLTSFSQTSKIVKKEMTQPEIDKIIKTFTTKEGEFREALNSYAYNRKALIHTIGFGGQITGEYRRESFMTFRTNGERFEKITYFPMETTGVVTAEDVEDLGGVNPYALEPASISQYNFTYLGKEKIDELDLYVFEVTPKVIPNPKKTGLRLFTGRVWVDDQDLQIVKSKGKGVPETKVNKFPIIETWRENIDGKYWFPSFASADDELVFDNGTTLKLRVRVKYTNYRQGRSEVKVLDEDVEETPTPTPTPVPKKP
jgi:hypothetical protein